MQDDGILLLFLFPLSLSSIPFSLSSCLFSLSSLLAVRDTLTLTTSLPQHTIKVFGLRSAYATYEWGACWWQSGNRSSHLHPVEVDTRNR